MAVTKSLCPTVAHVMARRKTRAVKMVVVANLAVTNSAVIIAAVKAAAVMKDAAEITAVVRLA